jgi:glycosyltransferase involved in cell wall biosynthesis
MMDTGTSYLVSIIIPVYNAAQHLHEAIESALCQTYRNLEIILVNDGSTDDPESIVNSFNDSRIRYYSQENKGQSAASNYGLNVSKGDFIKFFDADDIMDPGHIESQLNARESTGNALSFCSWARFYNDDIATARFIPESNWQTMEPLTWIKSAMNNKYDMMPGWAWLIPRSLLERTGGWNEELSLNNDFEFSIRLVLQATHVYFTPEAKMYYRSGQKTSLSAGTSRKAFAAAVQSAKIGCAFLLQKENTAFTRRLCANKLSYWLYQIYPAYPDLERELEREIVALGGTDRKLDESRLMNFLQNIVGWKMAKRLKLLSYRFGYGKYLLEIKKKWFPVTTSHREKAKLTIGKGAGFDL